MSSMERNKGKLWLISTDAEAFAESKIETRDNFYDTALEQFKEDLFDGEGPPKYMIVSGKVYEVEWEVYSETDCTGFGEVTSEDGGKTINFHTYHYNGGGCLEEVLEDDLAEMEGC